MEIVVYLIILAIGLAMSASKKNKQAKQRANGPVVQTKPPAATAQSAKRPLTQEEIKKAVEVLMKERAARQTPVHTTVKQPAPTVTPPHQEEFYEGQSFGDEGVDPCHDDMFETRRPVEEEPALDAAPAFHLAFTKDSVMNGIIMSEVLKRRV